ncbi:MAG: transposase [Minisyncoccia bacterium]
MQRNIVLSVGEYYHIYSRGVEKRKIFLNERDYERFTILIYLCNSEKVVHVSDHKEKKLIEFFGLEKGKNLVDIGAYCLMPNHFHLLLKEKIEGGITLFMKKLLTGYSMYFNKKYNRTGPLFEGRFKAKHLNYDQYLKYQFTYIHLNPIGIIDNGWKNKEISNVERGLKFLQDYKYSSFLDYSRGERITGKILNKGSFPEYFQNKIEFSDMVKEWMNFEKDDVKDGPCEVV